MTKQLCHGTRKALKQGDVIAPGDSPEGAEGGSVPPHVYLTDNLDAAIWDAEAAGGDGPARVYVVEPTGPSEDAPERKSAGHPSMSMRSRHPLRVTGEVRDWQGHPTETIKAMKDSLARLEQLGIEPIED